ncbi:response regulator [Chitinophaga tropicalis]|uniref:Response regulator n=1 Tax=Chitinophaga tropicalis TaxID=2683588 RepID=A0A7K1U365_9BACT|nr:response regulator [Chitinophaga tropicalis]MVT08726.1 response regulator [Chitinophaga tropicalis]
MATILIIEDNVDVRENTAEILQLANYKVFMAADGKEGVKLAEEVQPDLIVCDLTMPLLDGYGVLHLLSKKKASSPVPFIFLTAKSERSDVRKGMEMGADDYITKPFNPTELLNSIECQLRKAAAIRNSSDKGLAGLNSLLELVSEGDPMQPLKDGRNINRYKKKQCIYQETNHPSHLYYVTKGKVKTYRRNDDGKELITGLYNEGDFLGYGPLLEGGVYPDSAEAMAETELALIPRREFEELTNKNVQVMQRFIRLLSNNIQEKEIQLLNIAYNSLRKKVADSLLAVYKKYNSSGAENFGIDISRENLAAIAGVAKESMIRTLGDFRDEKLIDIRDGIIYLLNIKKLSNMYN